ncbi:MAG: hypothetical protein WCK05_08675 [Planctomycetota bacterium]
MSKAIRVRAGEKVTSRGEGVAAGRREGGRRKSKRKRKRKRKRDDTPSRKRVGDGKGERVTRVGEGTAGRIGAVGPIVVGLFRRTAVSGA